MCDLNNAELGMPWIPLMMLALDRTHQDLEIGCGTLGRFTCLWQPQSYHSASSWNQGCCRQEGTSQSHLGRKGVWTTIQGKLHSLTLGCVYPSWGRLSWPRVTASTCLGHLFLSLTVPLCRLPVAFKACSSLHPWIKQEVRPSFFIVAPWDSRGYDVSLLFWRPSGRFCLLHTDVTGSWMKFITDKILALFGIGFL